MDRPCPGNTREGGCLKVLRYGNSTFPACTCPSRPFPRGSRPRPAGWRREKGFVRRGGALRTSPQQGQRLFSDALSVVSGWSRFPFSTPSAVWCEDRKKPGVFARLEAVGGRLPIRWDPMWDPLGVVHPQRAGGAMADRLQRTPIEGSAPPPTGESAASYRMEADLPGYIPS